MQCRARWDVNGCRVKVLEDAGGGARKTAEGKLLFDSKSESGWAQGAPFHGVGHRGFPGGVGTGGSLSWVEHRGLLSLLLGGGWSQVRVSHLSHPAPPLLAWPPTPGFDKCEACGHKVQVNPLSAKCTHCQQLLQVRRGPGLRVRQGSVLRSYV